MPRPGLRRRCWRAGTELGLRFGLEQALGVIYAKTCPLYRRIGCAPDIIGSRGEGHDRISVGLWPISVEARAEISRRSGIPLSVMARWFDASFPARFTEERLAA